MNAERQQGSIAQGDGGYTPRTLVSLTQLAKACESIRTEGFVIDEEDFQEAVCCLAAPIRDKDGAIIASSGISAPLARFPQERNLIFARQVSDVAKEISGILSAEG